MSALINSLKELRDKVDELLKNVKSAGNLDENVIGEAIDLINYIIRRLDELGDTLLGFTEGEVEEDEELYT